ncbi:MAG: glycine cleavage system protein GcvH [bacterium]
MDIPKNCLYSRDHFWIRPEGNEAVIGVTDWAQRELGEIEFVDLPELEEEVDTFVSCGVLKSDKAVSDLTAPLSGEVKEVNFDLESSPDQVNEDPYGEGWLFRIEIADSEQLSALMTPEQYEDYIIDLEVEEE